MKLGVIPQNLIERVLMALGLVPTPLIDTMIGMLLARTVMVATRLGIFEALASGALTADEVALRCATHAGATKKLLDALVGSGYLRARGERYDLAPVARKWLLKESPKSLYDKMLFQFIEWDWIEQCEDFVRGGVAVNIHETMSEDQWGLYQRGIDSLASMWTEEIARRTPVPKGARDMLDIGGAHGRYSVALCRRHNGLRSVILDLPEAVAQAAPILAVEEMGDRVVHRAGDALSDDLGEEVWDIVFIAQVVHHFDDDANRKLARRVARALRPGGVFVIQEAIRPRSPKEGGQPGALLDLYFSLTSKSGIWSFAEMADWQQGAGLVPRKPIRFRFIPGSGQQVAVKP